MPTTINKGNYCPRVSGQLLSKDSRTIITFVDSSGHRWCALLPFNKTARIGEREGDTKSSSGATLHNRPNRGGSRRTCCQTGSPVGRAWPRSKLLLGFLAECGLASEWGWQHGSVAKLYWWEDHLSFNDYMILIFWVIRARFFSRKWSFKQSDLSKNRKKCRLWKTQLKRLMDRSFDRSFYRGKIIWNDRVMIL